MPKSSKLFILSTLCLLAVTLPVMANKTIPPNGTVITMQSGETVTTKVLGTGGCTFAVLVSSEDEGVAQASAVDALKKKHAVTITAVGVGTTDITIFTSGKDVSCSGFNFSYTVVVEPDLTAFVKQAKGKIKQAQLLAKEGVAVVNKLYCDELADISKHVKSGDLTVEEALDLAFDAYTEWADFYHLALDQFLDTTFEDIWTRNFEAGFLAFSDDLIGFLPGACGDWDKFEDKMKKLADKGVAQGLKKFKKLAKVLGKFAAGDDAELQVVIEHPEVLLEVDIPVALPAVVPQVPAEALPKALEKSWTGSGSLSTASDSGLIMGGSADPGEGDVTVTINGPDGFMESMTVPVNKECEWKVKFTGLPRGSYTVELSQGGNPPVGFMTPVV